MMNNIVNFMLLLICSPLHPLVSARTNCISTSFNIWAETIRVCNLQSLSLTRTLLCIYGTTKTILNPNSNCIPQKVRQLRETRYANLPKNIQINANQDKIHNPVRCLSWLSRPVDGTRWLWLVASDSLLLAHRS